MIRKSIISAGFGAGVMEYGAEVNNNPSLRVHNDLEGYTPEEKQAYGQYRKHGYEWAKKGGWLRMPEVRK